MLPDGILDPRVARDFISKLREYKADRGYSHADLARAIGANPTYISLLLSRPGELPDGTADELCRKLNLWMEQDYRAAQARRDSDALVDTVVAQRFIGIARNVQVRRDIGVAYGPAGCGKTCCAQAALLAIPGAMLVSVHHDTRSAAGLLRYIEAASRSSQRVARYARFDSVVDRLRRSGRLLLVDQAHDLRDSGLRLLKDLHDECELPILLIGTVDVLRRVTDDHDPQYGQLSSRIGLRVSLAPEITGAGGRRRAAWITTPQVRAMFQRGKLKLHPDAAKLLADIANYDVGLLRRAGRVFAWAAFACEQDAAAVVSEEHVRTALRWIYGDDPRSPNPPQTQEPDATVAAG